MLGPGKIQLQMSFVCVSVCCVKRGSPVQISVTLKEPRPFLKRLQQHPLPTPLSSPNTPAQNGSGSWSWQDVNQGRANE